MNLRRLGTGSSALSNFRRIYGAKGFVKLLLVELVRDILPILIGGLLMGIKGQTAVGRAFAGFCLVMGRLYPVFYNLKGSHAIICMLVVMAFVNFSGALAVLLFMIPADSDDVRRDYEVLLGELTQYNPELLDKERLLAVTKCDMLDEELIEQMKPHLPEGIPSVFISSVSGLNIARLKDMLWEALQR